MTVEGFPINPGTGPLAEDIAVDTGADGKLYQGEQPVFGPLDGTKVWVENVDGKRLPVGGDAIGLPGETAPTTDTASSGLNGRLQRVAQRLTTIFGALGDTADPVVAAGAQGSITAKLRAISRDIVANIVLAAGTNVIGRLLRAEATATMTVTVGGTQSGSVDCRGYVPVGLIVPSTFDGSLITWQASPDNVSYFAVYEYANGASPNAVVQTVLATTAVPIPSEVQGWNFIRVVCGTAQASTDTIFTVQLKA